MHISNTEIDAVVDAVSVDQKKSGQFCHVATYARKVSLKAGKKDIANVGDMKRRIWTVSDISKEADRDPDHIPHVKNPLVPKLIFGRPVAELEAICDEMLVDAKQSNGKSLRADSHVLLAAVYSLPIRPEYYEENKEKCDRFIADSIAWHKKTYGEVISAVQHLDETYIHFHVYSISNDARGMIAGWREKRTEIKKCLDAGESKSEANRAGNRAYKAAMVKIQNSYFEEVGCVNELARYGNRRLRYQPGGPESTMQKLEREQYAIHERAARELQEINRKKLSESIAEQEKINFEASKRLAEIKAEKKALRNVAQVLLDTQKLTDEREFFVEQTVKRLMASDEFLRDAEFKETKKLLVKANEKIRDLEYDASEKDSYIDKLLGIVENLKKHIVDLTKQVARFCS